MSSDAEHESSSRLGILSGRSWNPLRRRNETNDNPSPSVRDAFSISQVTAECDSETGTFSHVSTRLPDSRHGLLIDPGALHNLVGSEWIKQVASKAKECHVGHSKHLLDPPFSVQGVGTGVGRTNEGVQLPIALSEDSGKVSLRTYHAPTEWIR